MIETPHTYSIQKISLFFLLSTVISLILFIPFSSAVQNLTLDSPDSAQLSQSFLVNIDFEESKNYSVKIFVEDPSSSPKTISEIYSESEWKNSYFYISQAFPSQKEFQVRINKLGSWQICVRLKNSTLIGPECNDIIILENSEINPSPQSNIAFNSSPQQDIPSNNSSQPNNIKTFSFIVPNPAKIDSVDSNLEPIILKPKDSPISFTTSNGYIRTAIWVSFTLILLIITILLSLRKL